MAGTVAVVIPVEAEAAAALTDTCKREAVGRIVSRILRPQPQPDHDPLLEAMQQLDANAKGLTPAMLAPVFDEVIDELHRPRLARHAARGRNP